MAIKKPNEANNPQNKNIESSKNAGIKTEKIPVDLDAIDDEQTVQMEFVDDEQMANSHAAEQTKTSKDETIIDDNTPIEQVRKDINDYEESKSGKLEYKDLKQTAAFLINLIDTALSTAFRLIARDTSSSAYAIPEPNKKLLIEQLALILAKYQSKFKIEFMFIMGLIVLYSPAAIAAVNNRKKVNNAKKSIKTAQQQTQTLANENAEQQTIVEKKEDAPIIDEINVGIKRKKGKQPKAY